MIVDGDQFHPGLQGHRCLLVKVGLGRTLRIGERKRHNLRRSGGRLRMIAQRTRAYLTDGRIRQVIGETRFETNFRES